MARPEFPKTGKLIELGCGAGNVALWFAQKGYAVRGIDISPAARSNGHATTRPPRSLPLGLSWVMSSSTSRSMTPSTSSSTASANIAPVLDGRAGVTFTEPSCIERHLFARQSARYPMVEHPTEFGAFILRGNGRAHIYFSSMDMVGQKIRRHVTERVEADIKNGFVLVAHLHSHPFLLDRKVGDRMWTTADTITDVAGALAPSLADAALWKSAATEWSMQAGWITNGFDSSRMQASKFGLLAAHDH